MALPDLPVPPALVLSDIERPGRTGIEGVRLIEKGGLLLSLQGDGQALAPAARPGGRGLRDLHTRAEALRGRCEAGPVQGGYQVQAWLPARSL
ncbi:hypothetical protein GCM10023185_19720 [Hymenobacter saemangeumensis]|uniref:Uncharacterized protein n=1 Tax=Hymenobacter saemangeumensis TaxID=1084522 RepID=A0ABP8ID83_9BACT